MKIRNNIKGVTCLLLITGMSLLTSCEKFLDQQPQDSLTAQEFFKTEEDANAAVFAAYDKLQECVDEFLVWGEVRADLISPVTAKNDYTWPYENSFTTNLNVLKWGVVYQLIARANVIIERVPAITALDNRLTEEESNALVGEAKFLRALGYFYLVRTFGEVPLVLQAPLDDNINFRVAKSPESEIYAQIEADLLAAEIAVPVQYSTNVFTRGRATKGAVNAMLADMYLWQGKYTEAAAAAKKVIDNTNLYGLVEGDNWFSIFSSKNTRESVFEVGFDYTIKETNNLSNVSRQFLLNSSLLALYESSGGKKDVKRGLDRTYNNSTSGSIFWKYIGLSVTDIYRPGADADFMLYRLADVKLMRAEALSHSTLDEERIEAYALLNEIRNRAGLDSYNYEVLGLETNALVDLILNERAMEFAMEGKRWFDLVRVGKNGRPEVLIEKIVASRRVADRALTRARITDPRSWVLPIHQDEIQLNLNLKQNPYYQ